jgi:hypothetical protein
MASISSRERYRVSGKKKYTIGKMNAFLQTLAQLNCPGPFWEAQMGEKSYITAKII